MSILRSVGFEYIIIGESTLQTNSSFQLKNTLDKSAELKFTSVENNIPVAFLYKIPAVTFKDVLWQNTGNATVWKTNSNTNSSSLNLLSNGEQVVRLNFSSGYPPSLWFKINQELSSPIDLNNASLYSIFSVNQNSNVTITLSLIDQTGTNAEIVLKNACDNYSGQYVSYMKLSDLVGSQSHVDLSRIHRVELTFYNAGKTSETIGISTFEFVK